jgi:hypothetical protein
MLNITLAQAAKLYDEGVAVCWNGTVTYTPNDGTDRLQQRLSDEQRRLAGFWTVAKVCDKPYIRVTCRRCGLTARPPVLKDTGIGPICSDSRFCVVRQTEPIQLEYKPLKEYVPTYATAGVGFRLEVADAAPTQLEFDFTREEND